MSCSPRRRGRAGGLALGPRRQQHLRRQWLGRDVLICGIRCTLCETDGATRARRTGRTRFSHVRLRARARLSHWRSTDAPGRARLRSNCQFSRRRFCARLRNRRRDAPAEARASALAVTAQSAQPNGRPIESFTKAADQVVDCYLVTKGNTFAVRPPGDSLPWLPASHDQRRNPPAAALSQRCATLRGFAEISCLHLPVSVAPK
jgi:hypothetical protein